MHKKNIAIIFAILIIAIAIVLMPYNSSGYSSGIKQKGCSCHGTADTNVAITIEGLPNNYTANTTYNLTISASSSISGDKGGFYLFVSAGNLSSTDGNVSVSGKEANHTNSNSRTWQLQWTSPSEGDVNFYVAVNTVDGDGSFNGDAWNFYEKTIAKEGTTVQQPLQPTTEEKKDEKINYVPIIAGIIIILFVFGIACVFYLHEKEIPKEQKRIIKTNIKIALFFLIVVAIVILIAYSIPEQKKEVVEGNSPIAVGKSIVETKCLQCHIAGNPPGAPANDLKDIGKVSSQRTNLTSTEYLVESLLEPSAYVVSGYKNIMPSADSKQIGLTDKEIVAVVMYLQSLGGTIDTEENIMKAIEKYRS